MWYKNLTIKFKKDGFGCQLNAKLSGLAFCENHMNYRYVHTPFTDVSHGCNTSKDYIDKINTFVGIPDNRKGKKIHVAMTHCSQVFNNPSRWWNNKSLEKIRGYYWTNEKPYCMPDIVVHIRRGDIHRKRTDGEILRFIPNSWYNKHIPIIADKYPDHFMIDIFSEGKISDFLNITKNWPKDLKQRTRFNISEPDDINSEFDVLTAFHHMVCAKVFVQAKSGLSYTAGLYNENHVYFLTGSRAMGQHTPLKHWFDYIRKPL